jgi:hypothetical protein
MSDDFRLAAALLPVQTRRARSVFQELGTPSRSSMFEPRSRRLEHPMALPGVERGKDPLKVAYGVGPAAAGIRR